MEPGHFLCEYRGSVHGGVGLYNGWPWVFVQLTVIQELANMLVKYKWKSDLRWQQIVCDRFVFVRTIYVVFVQYDFYT